jgi:hypothetical protein
MGITQDSAIEYRKTQAIFGEHVWCCDTKEFREQPWN